MSQIFPGSAALIVILATSVGVFLAWLITRKRVAETMDRASKEAQWRTSSNTLDRSKVTVVREMRAIDYAR